MRIFKIKSFAVDVEVLTNVSALWSVVTLELYLFAEFAEQILKRVLTSVYINAIMCITYIYIMRWTMDIIISNSSGEPIYQQISSQIKTLILNGALKAGDALPSMRTLAQQLRISVITTKRAYEDLERDGFIESYTGKGSFVKGQNTELLREEYLRQTEALLRVRRDRWHGLLTTVSEEREEVL